MRHAGQVTHNRHAVAGVAGMPGGVRHVHLPTDPHITLRLLCAAANHIRNGDADVMIAGGSEAPIIPVGLGGFVACRCAPQPGCRCSCWLADSGRHGLASAG